MTSEQTSECKQLSARITNCGRHIGDTIYGSYHGKEYTAEISGLETGHSGNEVDFVSTVKRGDVPFGMVVDHVSRLTDINGKTYINNDARF